jgi:ABC-type phosphate transport system substrate-binding protein
MMKAIGVGLLVVVGLDVAPALGADDATEYKVVVNAANPLSALTRESVARIFLKKVTTWPNGKPAHPVDQPTNSACRGAFSRAVLGKDPGEVASYLNQLIFSGRGVPPVTRPSDAEVLSYVQNDANAIGYVAGDAKVGEGVKVVAVTAKE